MAVSGTHGTLSADGNFPSTGGVQTGGRVVLHLSNDFGTGTAKLQMQLPDGEWDDVVNGSFTAATDTVFDFPERSNNVVRVNLASSSSPDLDILIQSEADDVS